MKDSLVLQPIRVDSPDLDGSMVRLNVKLGVFFSVPFEKRGDAS